MNFNYIFMWALHYYDQTNIEIFSIYKNYE